MNKLACLLALAAVSATAAVSSRAGTYANITPDGEISDWASVPAITLSFSNGVDNGRLDIAEVRLANNGTHLFALITYVSPVNPNGPVDEFGSSWNGPTLYFGIDRDSDSGTGFQPFGGHPGIEGAWRNDIGLDTLNGGNLSANAAISPFGVATLTQEISVSLTTVLSDSSALFGGEGSTFTFVFYTRGNNYTDAGAPIDNAWDKLVVGTYTIAAIPEPSAFAALAGLGVLGLAAGRRRR